MTVNSNTNKSQVETFQIDKKSMASRMTMARFTEQTVAWPDCLQVQQMRIRKMRIVNCLSFNISAVGKQT